jgi:hypothetical protein
LTTLDDPEGVSLMNAALERANVPLEKKLPRPPQHQIHLG